MKFLLNDYLIESAVIFNSKWKEFRQWQYAILNWKSLLDSAPPPPVGYCQHRKKYVTQIEI